MSPTHPATLALPPEPTDHAKGSEHARVVVVEYGDFECPSCKVAATTPELLIERFPNQVRFIFRHFPLEEAHPHALLAAESAEAAGAQGKFWEMHDLLLDHQDHLRVMDLVGYATDLGLDVDRFREALHRHTKAGRVADDVDSASLSGVSGTPTFFVNGLRHYGAYDIDALTAAVKTAKSRELLLQQAAAAI
jgi:protein-disulfide isomerase